jgi:hypothetical protein
MGASNMTGPSETSRTYSPPTLAAAAASVSNKYSILYNHVCSFVQLHFFSSENKYRTVLKIDILMMVVGAGLEGWGGLVAAGGGRQVRRQVEFFYNRRDTIHHSTRERNEQ